MERNLEKRLRQRDIRPTAVRLLVAQALSGADRLLSLAELEAILSTVPKSSIFRALQLFVERHVAHCVEDGNGEARYELCDAEHVCSIEDLHAHFYCEACRKTFCLKTIRVPAILLPSGFEGSSVNYMIKGFCKDCSSKI